MLGPNIHSSWESMISIMNSRLLEFIIKSRFSSSNPFQNASLARTYGSYRRSRERLVHRNRVNPLIDVGSSGVGSC